VREGSPGIDREGREQREDLALEIRTQQPLCRRGERDVIQHLDPLGGELGDQTRGERALEGHRKVMDDRMDAIELLLGHHGVAPCLHDLPGEQLIAQHGDPRLIELVEEHPADRQELHPLQERILLVLGLLEDAGDQGERAQFAVEIQARLAQIGERGRDRRGGGGRHEGVRRRFESGHRGRGGMLACGWRHGGRASLLARSRPTAGTRHRVPPAAAPSARRHPQALV